MTLLFHKSSQNSGEKHAPGKAAGFAQLGDAPGDCCDIIYMQMLFITTLLTRNLPFSSHVWKSTQAKKNCLTQEVIWVWDIKIWSCFKGLVERNWGLGDNFSSAVQTASDGIWVVWGNRLDLSRKEREIRLRTMARWDIEMKGQERVKSNWDKMLQDLGREIKHCACCKVWGTQTVAKGREEGRKRATVNQQSGTWRAMENCGYGQVWNKDKGCWTSCWNYYRWEKLQICSHWNWHQDFSFPFTVNHNLLITLAKTPAFQQMPGPSGSII